MLESISMTKQSQFIAGVIVLTLALGSGAYALGFFHFEGITPRLGRANQVPSLTKEIAFSANLSADSRAKYSEQIEKTRALLRDGAEGSDAWLELALQYRAAGDSASAAEIWKYLTVRFPTEYIAFRNLGAYYLFEKKDYRQSEKYYRRAIEANPAIAISYKELFEMYHSALHQDDKAEAILKEGIDRVAEEQNADLYTTLGTFYKETHQVDKARAAFTDARTLAIKFKNAALVKALDQELANLR